MTDPEPRRSLTDQERAQLERARSEYGSIGRAARLATMTLWTVGGFGVLTLLWALVAGAGGFVVGAALVLVAWNERRGRDRLRALDPEGARILGWNQVILAVVITVYLGLVIVRARTTPNASVQELEQLVGVPSDLVAQLTTVVYGTVIVVVDLVQAFMARFHFRRVGMVKAFRADTPDWVTEILTELA